MELMTTHKIEASKQNIEQTIKKIKQFASDNNYQIIGELRNDEGLIQKIFNFKLAFESKRQEKRCSTYLTRLDKKMSMRIINQFLHFMYKKVYKISDVSQKTPYIEYSVKELQIKTAQKAWKKSLVEMKKLHLAYKIEKGDFYKK